MLRSLPDAGRRLLNIVQGASAGRAGNVIRTRQARPRSLQNIESQEGSQPGIRFPLNQHGISNAVAQQGADIAGGHQRHVLIGNGTGHQRILQQNQVPVFHAGSQKAERIHGFHVQAVLHGDNGRFGQFLQRLQLVTAAGVHLNGLQLAEGQLRHHVPHRIPFRLEGVKPRIRHHHAHGLLPAQAHPVTHRQPSLPFGKLQGIIAQLRFGEGRNGIIGTLRRLERIGQAVGHRHFPHGVLRQGNAQGIPNAVRQQGPDAHRALDAAVLSAPGFRHPQMNGIIPVRPQGIHAFHQQAVGGHHHLHVGSLHGKHQGMVIQVPGNLSKLNRALHHPLRRIAKAVQNAVGQGAVVGPDAHRAAMLPAKQHQGRKLLPQAVQFLTVFGVRILPHFKLLLVDEIARINAYLLHPLGGLHGGVRLEMNISYQRHMATRRAQFTGNILQIGRIRLGLGGQADNLAPRRGQFQSLLHAGIRIPRIGRQHGLDPDGIGAAHPHIPHHDFTGHAARITVRTRTIGRLHETTLPRQIPLSTILQKRKAFSRQPINIEKGTEPFPLHEDLIRFTAN